MTPELTRVLVADDDQDIRDLVTFKLKQAGFSLRAVDDGFPRLPRSRRTRPTWRCSM